MPGEAENMKMKKREREWEWEERPMGYEDFYFSGRKGGLWSA